MKALRKLGSGLGGVVDDAVLTALRFRFLRSSGKKDTDAEALAASGGEHDRRALLQQAIDYYERPDVRAGFFQTPPPVVPTERARGRLDDDGRVVDLGWPSPFEPHWEAVRPDYLAFEPNRRARVRALLHPQPTRTALICLHGYQGGSFFVEERAFQARWLYSLGLDVALFTLPFHGVRAKGGGPSWPGPNPVRTNEGFGHAIYDLRALVAWLRSRPGAEAQRIAVVGMSLGGTTASLFATTDALDFVAPMIPVASWPELLWSHGEGQADRQRAERDGITLELLQRAMAVATPLERAPMLDPDRVLVLSSMGDRIAPPEHAERLARHFGGVHVPLPGGHVLQLGRREAFSAIAQRMALLGLIPKR
jgi:pimeloyl-ACP methyl ester carboxylesterase